jgi:hypothetical protein
MRRTRFYHNILNLAIERKHRRLLQRKAERERAKAARDYRIGLMIRMDQAYLTNADLALCDRLYALALDDVVTREDKQNLHKLIMRLLPDPRAVMLYVADPDEIDDGIQMRKAG